MDLEAEALAETGNIILNSWARPSAFKISLPMISRGDGSPMFESATSSLVLSLHSELVIRQKQIGGYALLMDIPSNRVP